MRLRLLRQADKPGFGQGQGPYAYYRCTGSDAYRFGGQRLCWNKQIRTDILDAAVWEDVSRLLSEPERVRAEYQRRLQRPGTDPDHEVEHINKTIRNLKKLISRLIDAYGDGLIEKSEFEPRILAAKQRLAKWEEECRQRMNEATQEAELRLVIGQLEEFASRVSQELQEPSWETRREIIRALVRKVEVDEEGVRIVYRVRPSPFEQGPQHGSLLHCWGRDTTPLRDSLLGPSGASSSLLVGLENGTVQEPADPHQHRAVGDPSFQTLDQGIVRDRVEVRFQIRVVDLAKPGGEVLADRVDRLMSVPTRTEPVGAVQEVGLKDRLEHQQNRRLNDPVFDRRNSQRSHPAVRLGDVHTLDRLRPVAPGRSSSDSSLMKASAPGPSMMSWHVMPSTPAAPL